MTASTATGYTEKFLCFLLVNQANIIDACSDNARAEINRRRQQS